MRYFIEFAYDGTDFHGSQTQPNGNTVQAEMEAAFATILREPVALTFAGRTDAESSMLPMIAVWKMELMPHSACVTSSGREMRI